MLSAENSFITIIAMNDEIFAIIFYNTLHCRAFKDDSAFDEFFIQLYVTSYCSPLTFQNTHYPLLFHRPNIRKIKP